MNKFLSKITKFLSVLAIALLGFVVMNNAKTNALSLNYGSSTGTAYPSFNNFVGVPGIVGDEHDFVRAKIDGEANSAYRNSVDTQCVNGSKFKVWLYVHNNAQETLNNNGAGTGVAKGVKAKVTLPTGEQTSFNVSGSVSAINASAVSDNAVINCGGKSFKISYVKGSASAYLDHTQTNLPVDDSIVTTGASIGSTGMNGDVWGCFGERVWIGMFVEVTEIQQPVVSATCDSLTAPAYKVKEGDTIDFTANASAQNASISGYNFSVNGNQVQSGASKVYSFKQAKAGIYTVSVTANVSNGTVASSTANCVKQIEVTATPVSPNPVCGPLTVTEITRNTRKVKIAYSPSNDSRVVLKKAIYNFNDKSDSSDVISNTNTNEVTYTYVNAGTYKLSITLIIAVDGVEREVTGVDCMKDITVVPDGVNTVCGPLTVTVVDRNTRKIKVTYSPSNDSRVVLKSVVYNFNDIDGDSDVITKTDLSEVTYVYSKDGTYKLVITITLAVDNIDTSISGEQCSSDVTVAPAEELCTIGGVTYSISKTDSRCVACTANTAVLATDTRCPHVQGVSTTKVNTPTTLPNTGAGSMLAMFIAVVLAGSVAHNVYSKRSLN